MDDVLPEENAWTTVSALAEQWPCFYVTGNHEWWSGEAERICDHMEALGVHVLRGDAMTMELNGEKITFCGIDDPDSGESGQQLSQLEKCDKGDTFTILLAHRPEEITSYLDGAYDLILSGHAHGGQWRIPGILNGCTPRIRGCSRLMPGDCISLMAPCSWSAGALPGRALVSPGSSTVRKW